jgi:RNA polymerase sigma-70 factor (ECF subfamily)
VSGDYAALTDGELATLARGGRDAAFAALMQRHRRPVYRLIVNNVADADEALDLVQETFLSAHRALGRYDETRSMRTWLAAIALNKCRDWARRRALRRFLWAAKPIDDWADSIASDMPDHGVAAEDRQLLARLRRAIAELPASLREPLVLCAVEEMSQAEAALMLGITVKAVETRVRRARIRLETMLGSGGSK